MRKWNFLTEEQENYRKNLRSIQEVTDKLLSSMKGHNYSFRLDITDKNGEAFNQDKLCAMVEDMLSLWAAEWKNADKDPASGKSAADSYLEARRELYGIYLYLVMRCSLYSGGYALVFDRDEKERTTFTFLLEKAKQLTRNWCVTASSDGAVKKNELYDGYDKHFGFHFFEKFHAASCGQDISVLTSLLSDWALTPDWQSVENRGLETMTNEGIMKRMYIISGKYHPLTETKETKEAAGSAEDVQKNPTGKENYDTADDYDEMNEENDDNYDTDEDFDAGGLFYDYDIFDDPDVSLAIWEEEGRNVQRAVDLEYFILQGLGDEKGYWEEYLSACRRFKELFEQAGADVLREFYEDLESIVNIYLAEKNLSPLTDTNKTLNVYGSIYDEAFQQARRCERGIQWKKM